MKKYLLILVTLLAGCAGTIEGVEISEDERKACAEQGCTVWTQQELQGIARQFFMEGVKRGKGSL